MTRLTRRQSALSWNSQAPLDMERPVPAKKKRDPGSEREWKLQAACIKEVRARMKLDRSLAYMVPGATQTNLKPAQRAFAKLMGWQAGLPDIWLMRTGEFGEDSYTGKQFGMKWHIVELKLPGKTLSGEQEGWFRFLNQGYLDCSRIDNIHDFCKLLDQFCA